MHSVLCGQTVLYYGVNSKPVDDAVDARLKKELIKKSDKRFIIITSVVSNNTKKKNEGWLMTEKEKIRIEKNGTLYISKTGEDYLAKKIRREMIQRDSGLYEFSDLDAGANTRKVIRTGFSSTFLPLHLEGTETAYYSNGNIKSISQFRNNQLISNQNWLQNGDKYIDSIFYSADREPVYQMGSDFFHKYLLQNLYNSNFDLAQIREVVEVAWVVMENGEMAGVISLSESDDPLNLFLVKCVADLPGKWQPATLDGKAVRYFISVPLNFQHRDISFQDVELSSGSLFYNKY